MNTYNGKYMKSTRTALQIQIDLSVKNYLFIFRKKNKKQSET